jgi:hypothetical protein
MSQRPRLRWAVAMLGIVAAATMGVWLPSTAQAADRGLIAVEPVSFDGKTYTGTDKAGPFSKGYPTGLDKSDPDSATATLDKDVKVGTTYPWGSIGAKNGSFIQNKTGKPICKIVVTATDGNTFDTAPQTGDGWTAEVSKDKKTITFTAKEAKFCIPDGGWFWMKVPKSPQPGSGTPPTLEGSIAAATPADPSGETAVVALTDDSAFVASLTALEDAEVAASASATPTPVATATVPVPGPLPTVVVTPTVVVAPTMTVTVTSTSVGVG